VATTFSDHGTLVANTVTTVTLTAPGPTLTVINHGSTDPIYFTYGTAPSDPTVKGDDTRCCPPSAMAHRTPGPFVTLIVKLISVGTPDFSVET
jgi:hypothetical protein